MEPSTNRASVTEPSNLAHIASLQDLSGRVRIEVAGEPVATVEVDHGDVRLMPLVETFDAVFSTCDRADLQRVVAGELNPVVASIQGRVAMQGNVELVVRVFLGLRAERIRTRQKEER